MISSINGQNTKELTNSEAHGLLKNAGESLKLGLNEYVYIKYINAYKLQLFAVYKSPTTQTIFYISKLTAL